MARAGLPLKVWEVLRDLPILVKVMGIAFGTPVLLGAGILWLIHHQYYQMETRETEEQAEFVGQILAAEAVRLMQHGGKAELQALVEEVGRALPKIKFIRVLDADGRSLASVFPPCRSPSSKELKGLIGFAAGPVRSVEVAMTDSQALYEVGWQTRRVLGLTAGITLAGMVASWALMRRVTRPIGELVEVTRAGKAGQLETRARVRSRDEVGELAAAFNDMMVTVQRKQAANHQLLRKLIAAEEVERKRVARELHDHTGQALTSLIATLAALETKGHPAELRESLALATQTLSEVHDLSRALHPSVLDDLGLVPAMQKLCEGQASRLCLNVEFAAIGLNGNSRLPSAVEVSLYRIGQEALTNAARHGQARSVEVLVQRKPAAVLVIIEDDGRGFEASNWREQCLRGDHLGLLGIEERAALLGGTLRVESRPGAGTSLFVEIPVPNESL